MCRAEGDQGTAGGGDEALGQEGLERDDDNTVFLGDFMFAESPGVSKKRKGSWRHILAQPTQMD